MVMSPQWSLETKSFFSTIRGDSRESNPGPRPPEGRIMPLDHYPKGTQFVIQISFYTVIREYSGSQPKKRQR